MPLMHYLIIGVDPGHTIGLAALDLSGKPLKAIHIQQGGFEAALAALESWGTPSLIASDVRPAPELVLRLASAFNAALFVPERPWREEDKKRAVREAFEHFSFPVENVHERDALSAAVQAWRHHQNLLRQSSGLELSEADLESLRHLLLQGFRQSIALEMLKKAKEPKQSEPEILPHAQLPRAESVPSTPAISLTTERVISELKKRINALSGF